MFTIFNSQQNNRQYRREFLSIGSSAIGGIGLSSLLAMDTRASLKDVMHDRSVTVLNLQGGPTQFETFDPKMTAPREVRSITGEIRTAVPSVTFGSGFP